MPAKKKLTGLGSSLMKKKNKQPQHIPEEAIFFHQTFEEKNKKSKNLKSTLEQDNLQDFLQEADLSSKNYEAIRDVKIANQKNQIIIDLNELRQTKDEKEKQQKLNETLLKSLRIPRRPKYTEDLTKEEFKQMENEAFLKWRRDVSKVEESNSKITITPYEKNIEVWKQLWRVIDRSDLVIQIVDGRDPLFFRCKDMEDYVKEVSQYKGNFLLINKSDLLAEDIRKEWNRYFLKENVNHIFFSALEEQSKIDSDTIQEEEKGNYENTYKICNRITLVETLKRLASDFKVNNKDFCVWKNDFTSANPELVTIGVVGFPNVGKSSLINVLSVKKMVGVACQPGKTKHFQTIYLQKNLLLCDCPGLVFPSAEQSRAEMVLNGVIPIDNLKDYLSAVQLICDRVPKHILESLYHINLPTKYNNNAEIFLDTYCVTYGLYNGQGGMPARNQVARVILKDTVKGKLLYCQLPPDIQINDIIQHNRNLILKEQKKANKEKPKQTQEGENDDLDENDMIMEQKDEILDTFNKDKKKAQRFKGIHEDDEENLDGAMFKSQQNKILFNKMSEDDLVSLASGGTINGIKLNKIQKREIKHAIQRGEITDIQKIFTQEEDQNYDLKIKQGKKNFFDKDYQRADLRYFKQEKEMLD